MNEMILCVIRNGDIAEYSTANTAAAVTDIMLDFLDKKTTTVAWIKAKDGRDPKADILEEYNRRVEVRRIAEGLGR